MRFNSATLSRRALFARASVVGASALALPLLACQLSDTASGVIQPTVTPSAGAVSSGRYRIVWQKTAHTPPGVSASDLAAMAQGYGKALDAAYATEQQYMQQDLQALTQVSDTYSKSFTAALGKVGMDVAQLQADLEAFGKLTDAQEIAAAAKALDTKYLPYYAKAYATAGMDRAGIVTSLSQQIRPHVSNPKQITPALNGQQLGWGWIEPLPNLDPPPPPSPCDSNWLFLPPYGWNAYNLADGATPSTPTPYESLDAAFSLHDHLIAGSNQQLAARGSGAQLGSSATHVHVEADFRNINYYTRAVGVFGYASAEAILTLRLTVPTDRTEGGLTITSPGVVAENRISLARSIAAVCTWDEKGPTDLGAYTLALDYSFAAGSIPDNQIGVSVQLETWVGCFGGVADAAIGCILDRIRVQGSC